MSLSSKPHGREVGSCSSQARFYECGVPRDAGARATITLRSQAQPPAVRRISGADRAIGGTSLDRTTFGWKDSTSRGRLYQKHFGERLHERVAAALKPCIVKFETVEENGNRLVAPALSYCWHKIHNQKLSCGINAPYDGGGMAIPNTAIRRVEFP
jgi:hypothetical protein